MDALRTLLPLDPGAPRGPDDPSLPCNDVNFMMQYISKLINVYIFHKCLYSPLKFGI